MSPYGQQRDNKNQLIQQGGGGIVGPYVTSVNGFTGVVVLTAADVGALASGHTVNGYNLATDPVLVAADVGAVPTSRTVNGYALTANITITASDVGAPSGSGTSTGTNTGDQTIILTGDVTGSGTGSFAATLQPTSNVVEIIQDAVGTILVDTARIDLTYNDATPSITADIVLGSVTEDYLGLSDVTTMNATTARHGLLKKLSNNSTQFMDGAGNWTVPGASGGAGSIGYMLTIPLGYGTL